MILTSMGAAWAAELAEVEQLISEKWDGVTAFRADISIDVKVPVVGFDLPSEAEGSIEMVAEEDVRRYRLDVTNRIAKSFLMRKGLRQDVLTIYDGEFEYTELKLFGQTRVTKRVPDPEDANRPMGGSAVFDRMRKQGDVSLAGESRIDGVDTWIIEVTTNGEEIDVQGPIKPKRMRVYIGKASGLQVHMKMFDKKDKEILRMRYTNVQLNPKIDLARFSYSPPPGVKVKEGDPVT